MTRSRRVKVVKRRVGAKKKPFSKKKKVYIKGKGWCIADINEAGQVVYYPLRKKK